MEQLSSAPGFSARELVFLSASVQSRAADPEAGARHRAVASRVFESVQDGAPLQFHQRDDPGNSVQRSRKRAPAGFPFIASDGFATGPPAWPPRRSNIATSFESGNLQARCRSARAAADPSWMATNADAFPTRAHAGQS